MAIQLTIVNKNNPSTELMRGFVQSRVLIGRSSSCDICLPDMAVSTTHVEIKVDGTNYKVVDLDSLNGTRLAGKKLVARRPGLLRNNDVLELAGYTIRFRLGVAPGPMPPRDESQRQARDMLALILATSNSPPVPPSLVVVGGPSGAARHEFPTHPMSSVIGRSKDAQIRLNDTDVSRRHAEVHYDGETIRIVDLGSRNGILVDGQRVDELTLSVGQVFILGATSMALEHPVDLPLSTIQDAPEEQTSSFTNTPSLGQISTDADETEVTQEQTATEDPVAEQPDTSLPVGPRDPMDRPGQPGYIRTTREIPVQGLSGKSDLGLIVVGAIVLTASVAALLWLVT